jgi:hypothetical protein
MRLAEALERLPRGAAFRRIGRNREDLLPGLRSALQVLLPEGADDAHVEQRLGVLRVHRQRSLELRKSTIGLIHVVVRNTQIRARVDVARIDFKSTLVPPCGFCKPFRIEVHVAKLHASGRIAWVTVGRRFQLCGAVLVERRGGCASRRRGPLGLRNCSGAWRHAVVAADNPTDQHAKEDPGDTHNGGFSCHTITSEAPAEAGETGRACVLVLPVYSVFFRVIPWLFFRGS